MLTSALDWIHRTLRLVVGLLFVVLMVAVVFQIFTRLFMPKPPVWTEELSRFTLILITAFGAGLALRTGELVGVDLVTVNLSPQARRKAEIAICIALILFSIALVSPGLEFVDIGSIQTSPALDWNMFWMHLAVIIAPMTLALASFERLLTLISPAREAQ